MTQQLGATALAHKMANALLREGFPCRSKEAICRKGLFSVRPKPSLKGAGRRLSVAMVSVAMRHTDIPLALGDQREAAGRLVRMHKVS